jgi:hypothetical protein
MFDGHPGWVPAFIAAPTGETMSTLLKIDVSPRGEYSISRKLGNHFATEWQSNHVGGKIVTRDLATTKRRARGVFAAAGDDHGEPRWRHQQGRAGRDCRACLPWADRPSGRSRGSQITHRGVPGIPGGGPGQLAAAFVFCRNESLSTENQKIRAAPSRQRPSVLFLLAR